MGKGLMPQNILDGDETDQAAFLAHEDDPGATRQLRYIARKCPISDLPHTSEQLHDDLERHLRRDAQCSLLSQHLSRRMFPFACRLTSSTYCPKSTSVASEALGRP